MKILKDITPWETNFAKWYTDVVTKGQLIAYGKTKGSIIFKPISYGIWEQIQTQLNQIFARKAVENVYLPTLIPLEDLEREKKHIKGFAPELAMITQVGGRKLDNPFVLRPTSEVLFGDLFHKMVNSYNDLPIKFNQWANVFRWEKTTNPFLRTREFLWQEGHTVHASALEAQRTTREMLQVYIKFCQNYLALPTISGRKTPKEKFAGAVSTYTIEAMMKDGKALQVGTSHYLGQNFSKIFDIQFKNKHNQLLNAYQTSWGVSTRLIGAIIMTHGDNRGIVIPPFIAPYQVDIIELFSAKEPKVAITARLIAKKLRSYRLRFDRTQKSPGFKASKSEIEGTPLRIEIGPRDVANGVVTIIKRNTLVRLEVAISEVAKIVKKLLQEIHDELFAKAQQRLQKNLVQVTNYADFKTAIAKNQFVLAPFSGSAKDEKKIQTETGASSRCVPFEYQNKVPQKSIIMQQDTKKLVLFSKAY